jgi:putative flavoprotein involved in K+ transport
MLKQAGAEVVVLDKAGAIGASWRRHYDRLHLHTVRWLSHLPGYRLSAARALGAPRRRGALPRALRPPPRARRALGTEVRRIDRAAGRVALDTSLGPLEAERVVVATGYNHTPYLPEWPGRDGFTGELVHASRTATPEPYRGRDVLVVGSGNTGAEIAVDLVEGGARACAGRPHAAEHRPARGRAAFPTRCSAWGCGGCPAAVVDAHRARLVRRASAT